MKTKRVKKCANIGIMARLEREGWRLLTKERDNWKRKALAYREIIKKALKILVAGKGTDTDDYLTVVHILDEADKLEGKMSDKKSVGNHIRKGCYEIPTHTRGAGGVIRRR